MPGRNTAIAAREDGAVNVFPFWIIIIIVFVAIMIVTFIGICWYHSHRRPRAKVAAAEAETTIEPGPMPPGRQQGGQISQQTHEIPTLVFQSHEPETHGFFAPLYLNSSTPVNPELEAEAKEALRQYMTITEGGDRPATNVRAPRTGRGPNAGS